MSEVFFFIAGLGAVAGAIGVIALRNPFYTVLALVFHLLSLAAAVAAVMLPRRRRGRERAEDEAARLGIPAVAPPGTGSMAEGTGSLSLSPVPGRREPEQPTPSGGW